MSLFCEGGTVGLCWGKVVMKYLFKKSTKMTGCGWILFGIFVCPHVWLWINMCKSFN